MSCPQTYTDIVDTLYEQALRDYRQTEEHELRQQRTAATDRSCADMFSNSELAFVQECFAQLLDDSGARERAIYERGIRDSIALFRWLGAV